MNTTAIVIVGIIAYVIVSITEQKKSGKKETKLQDGLKAEHEQLKKELTEISERVVVLEKIVTDEKYQLHKEFSSLKN